MTEKEFRKLRSLDLIQILLTQGNEEARLQEELDRQKEHLAGLRERNDNLKIELNDKDDLIETLKQDLNKSDAEIRNLREELKTLYTDKRIDLENIGSLTEVAQRVNQIFETAQREAEEYLAHPERVQAMPVNTGSDEVAINHKLTVIDSVSTDDIKVEVAEKEFAAEATETSDTVIFEASDGQIETVADRTSENTDEVLSDDNMAADAAQHSAENTAADETIHSAESTAKEAAENHPHNNIEEVVTVIAEETVAKQEPQHHKTIQKKTHSNTNWFRRLIGNAKREKSGR